MRPKIRVGTMFTAEGPWRRAVKMIPTVPQEKATGNPMSSRRSIDPNISMVIHSILISSPSL